MMSIMEIGLINLNESSATLFASLPDLCSGKILIQNRSVVCRAGVTSHWSIAMLGKTCFSSRKVDSNVKFWWSSV